MTELTAICILIRVQFFVLTQARRLAKWWLGKIVETFARASDTEAQF